MANAINDYQSAPEYRATANGATVNVIIQAAGTTHNGKTLAITVTGNVTTSPSGTTTLAGGNLVTSPAGSETYLPGEYAKPAKAKMYSVAGSLLHFSEIEAPLDINNTRNAGFINLASNAEGSERLTSIASYKTTWRCFLRERFRFGLLTLTRPRTSLIQALNNVGAIAPHSVQEIGDSDVFFLSESASVRCGRDLSVQRSLRQ